MPSNESIPFPEIKIKRKAQQSLLNDTHPLPILALHIRRGDFKEHCANLAERESMYTGFNSFPEFRIRDAFDVPSIVNNDDEEILTISSDERYGDDDPRKVSSKDERKKVYA